MLENKIDAFLVDCTNKGLSKKTIASYEQALRMLQRYLKEEMNITEVKHVDTLAVEAYLGYLRQRGKYTAVVNERSKTVNFPHHRADVGKPISDTAIGNYLRNMKVFFNWLIAERVLKENPIKKSDFPRTERKPKEYLTDIDFDRLMRSFNTAAFSEYRDRVIIQLLLDSGMRIGECLLIKDADLNLQINTIFLPAYNTKGKKDRYVYFGDRMARELRRWLQFRDRYKDSEYLFCTNNGKPVTVTNFETNLRKYCKRVNVNNVTPHTFRNNFAKRFLMNGGDIYTLSRILGHSSVVVTEQAYLDLTMEDIKAKYKQFSPLSSIKRYY